MSCARMQKVPICVCVWGGVHRALDPCGEMTGSQHLLPTSTLSLTLLFGFLALISIVQHGQR